MREQFFHGGIGELTLRQAFNLFQQKAWNVLTVCHNVFQPPSMLQASWVRLFAGMGGFVVVVVVVGGGVWSVTLVADWGKLILIIQTDGALCEFMLRDDVTFLGSTIFRVTWGGEERRGKERKGGSGGFCTITGFSCGSTKPKKTSFFNSLLKWSQSDSNRRS